VKVEVAVTSISRSTNNTILTGQRTHSESSRFAASSTVGARSKQSNILGPESGELSAENSIAGMHSLLLRGWSPL
jgi:hypothetical protein